MVRSDGEFAREATRKTDRMRNGNTFDGEGAISSSNFLFLFDFFFFQANH